MIRTRARRRRLTRTVVVAVAVCIAAVLNNLSVSPLTLVVGLMTALVIVFAVTELVRHCQKWRP